MAAVKSISSRAHASLASLRGHTKPKSHAKGKSIPHHLFAKIVEKGTVAELQKNLTNIREALGSKEIEKAKQLFRTAVKQDKTIELALYTDLATDAKAKKSFASFKNLYCEYAAQEAVVQNNPEILDQALVEECECRKITKEHYITALNELDTPQSKKLASAISVISKVPFERHQLEPLDMLQVSIAADAALKLLEGRTDSIYMRAEDLGAKRACVLDPLRNAFTILSKSYGELQAEGAFKRVSDAVDVLLKEDSAKARSVAHVRNKADEYIPHSELQYEFMYGDNITWCRYKSKNRPDEVKTVIIQKLYDHDLYTFTSYWPEEWRKKITLEEMIQVLEDVGKTVQKMHADGNVHRDIKAKNALYRKKSNGKCEARLIDFGHTYVPKEEYYERKRRKGYGTLRYTAPDLLENPGMKGDPLFLAKAEDMYAIGEMIYEVFFQDATPWGSITYRALKKKGDYKELRKTAIRLQKEAFARLTKEGKSRPNTLEKDLIAIVAHLLDPDPKKRMKIEEFMSALYDLKARYAKLHSLEKEPLPS